MPGDTFMSTSTGTQLTLTYAPAATALNKNALRTKNILGIVLFNSQLTSGIGTDQNSGIIKTPLTIYGADICEIWSTTQPVIPGHYLDIRYRRSATLTLGRARSRMKCNASGQISQEAWYGTKIQAVEHG